MILKTYLTIYFAAILRCEMIGDLVKENEDAVNRGGNVPTERVRAKAGGRDGDTRGNWYLQRTNQ